MMSKNRTTSRRDFLKFAGAGGLVLGAASVPALGASPRESKVNAGVGSAKNIIFMVSDGMGLGTLGAAQQFLQLKENRTSHWMKVYQELPAVRSLVKLILPLGSSLTQQRLRVVGGLENGLKMGLSISLPMVVSQ